MECSQIESYTRSYKTEFVSLEILKMNCNYCNAIGTHHDDCPTQKKARNNMKKLITMIVLTALLTIGGCKTASNPDGATFWDVIDIMSIFSEDSPTATDIDVESKESEE